MQRVEFKLTGTVEAVLVASTPGSAVSVSVPKIQLVRDYGVKGDAHAGTRLVDVRENDLLALGISKGTEVANYRQFTAVSTEELAEIAAGLELPEPVPHGCLCENLVLSGIPKFSTLPTGTKMFFHSAGGVLRTAVLVVWAANDPCTVPGEAIQARFPDIAGVETRFPKAALGRRGVVGSVYTSGFVHAGDTVTVCVPVQQIYSPT